MSRAPLVEVSCPVCDSLASKPVTAVKDYLLRVTDATFGVRRCRSCGVGFLSPRPAAEDIGSYYPDHFYWSFEQSAEPISADQVLAQRSTQLKDKLRRIAYLQPGRLLDIGAMKGEFVHVATDAGWSAQGVEFSDRVPNLFGAPIRYGEFLDMEFGAQFDCVTMWAVLEHVYEPRRYVHKVGHLLKEGGSFVGVVTNFNSFQARFMRADDYPRHLTLFTKASLARLFAEAGLEPVRFWTDQRMFGGSLRGAVLCGIKRALGYDRDELLYEMRDRNDPEAFCCKFHQRPSSAMKWLSRLDSASLWLPEKLLDLSGCGLNLGFEARKVTP
jgi:SAM-dependent methyltransferase